MKRILSFVLSLMLICSLSCRAYAAEDERQADVYVKVVRTLVGVYPAPVEDGSAEVTTDDDITITVTELPDGAASLMVVPVPRSESEAWEWITDCLGDTGMPIHTFDIYFEDQNGDRIEANGAVVTIECPHCTGTPLVCALESDGTVRILNDSTQGPAVTFTANGSAYYVIADKAPAEHPGDPELPQTGDNSAFGLWFGVLILSTAVVLLLIFRKRKKILYLD